MVLPGPGPFYTSVFASLLMIVVLNDPNMCILFAFVAAFKLQPPRVLQKVIPYEFLHTHNLDYEFQEFCF